LASILFFGGKEFMSQQPNMGTTLLMVHHVITRGLTVSHKSSLEFAESGFPSPAVHEGYINFVRCTMVTLRAHHLTEDESVFPYFMGKLPDAPYAALNADHQKLEPLIPQIEAVLTKIESDQDPRATLRQIAPLLSGVQEVWHPHIQKEEQTFTPELLADLIEPQEHLRMIQQFAAHSQEIAKPDYLALPFFLYNLEPAERAQFSKALPPVVTEQLVPITWKDKWASMKPFLLA